LSIRYLTERRRAVSAIRRYDAAMNTIIWILREIRGGEDAELSTGEFHRYLHWGLIWSVCTVELFKWLGS
jgi:hypothetical protein